MTRTTLAASVFSSFSTRCTRMTMCGKPGSSTLPPESSAASACTKLNAMSRSAAVSALEGSPGGGEDRACMGGSRRSMAGSDAQRVAQGFDLVLRLVDQFLVAGAVDLHSLAGGDVVHVELQGVRVLLERGEQVPHGEHVGEVRRTRMRPMEILVRAHRRDDLLGHLPVLEQYLG